MPEEVDEEGAKLFDPAQKAKGGHCVNISAIFCMFPVQNSILNIQNHVIFVLQRGVFGIVSFKSEN